MSPDLDPALEALLRSWLPRQRWFTVKSPQFGLARAGGFSLPGTDGVELEVLVLAIESASAGAAVRRDIVQVPLSRRLSASPDLSRALVGELQAPDGGPLWIYDAVHDPAFVSAWLNVRPFRIFPFTLIKIVRIKYN